MSVHVPQTPEDLLSENLRAEELLLGRVITCVWRHHPNELGLEFTDGTRLFVDWKENGLELSITGTAEDEPVDQV